MKRTLAALAGCALLATACTSGSPSGTPTGAGSHGTLTVGTPADILTLDPAMHRNRDTENVIREIFNGLVNEDNALEPVPELATSWQNTDPLTWVLHLRHGVTFTNGEAFTADDVKFTIDRILDPAQKSPRASLLPTVASVTVDDPYTVTIKTKSPTANLLQLLAVEEIVPKDYVTKVGDTDFAQKPIGTGPFVFKSWTPNQQVVLSANPHYWGGAPKIQTVVFKPIPELATRVAALQSSDVQIAAQIPPDLAKTLTGNLTTKTDEGTNVYFVAMNVTKAPFTSQAVRQGVNYAIDRDTLVQGLYDGKAEVLNQPSFKRMVGYDASYQGYPFDLDKAKPLLGSVTQNIRLDVKESDLTLAQAVAGQLQKAGLHVTVNSMQAAAFTSSTESGKSTMYVGSWGVSDGDADSLFTTQFLSSSHKDQFFTGFSTPALDSLIEQGRSSLDAAVRKPVYAQATQLVMQAAPWAPLLVPQDIYGASTAVANWEPSSIGRYNLAQTTLSN